MFIPFLEQHTELSPEDEKLLAEIMETEDEWFRVPEDKENDLAAQLADFIEDVDPYGYQDALEIGETKEDAIRKIRDDLGNPEYVQSMTQELSEWVDELDDAEKKETCRKLIDGLTALAPEQPTNDDLIGAELTIDNRRYRIESVGEISGDVSMRDITFQNEAGFPVNRVEKISYIRRLLEQAQPQEEWMRQAKDLIDAFVRKEYDTDEGADYHDLSRVDIAYTTSSDDVHELQISADLLHFRLDTYIDNRLSASEQYQSLEDMVKNCLPHLDFSEMVADADAYLERHAESIAAYLQLRQSEAFRASPAWRLQEALARLQRETEYDTVFLPALEQLSPSYRRYREGLSRADAAFRARFGDPEREKTDRK